VATAEADAHSAVSAARDLIHIDDPKRPLSGPAPPPSSAATPWRPTWPTSGGSAPAAWRILPPGASFFASPTSFGNPDLAGRVHATWHGLTRSC
jgi:hypothetical protein